MNLLDLKLQFANWRIVDEAIERFAKNCTVMHYFPSQQFSIFFRSNCFLLYKPLSMINLGQAKGLNINWMIIIIGYSSLVTFSQFEMWSQYAVESIKQWLN